MQNKLRLMLMVCLTVLTSSLAAQLKTFSDSFESNELIGWTQDPASSPNPWRITSGLIAPGSDNAFDGTYYAGVVFNTEVSSSGTAAVKLITPMVNVLPLTKPILTFAAAAPNYNGRDQLKIYYRTDINNGWTSLRTVSGSDTWIPQTDSLLPLLNSATTIQIAFEYNPGNGRGIFLDKVAIGSAPNCPKPFDIRAATLTHNEITLAWSTEDNFSGMSHLKVSSSSLEHPETDVADIFDEDSIGFTTRKVTGLNPSTTYYAYVKLVCEDDDNSAWEEWQFITACQAVSVTPTAYSELFNKSGTELPSCWTKHKIYVRGTGTESADDPMLSSDYKRGTSGGQSLYLHPYAFAAVNYATRVFAVTPPVDVADLATCVVKFWLYDASQVTSLNTPTTRPLYVGTMTDPDDPTTFQLLYTVEAKQPGVWEEITLPLSASIEANKYVAFMADASPYDNELHYKLYIDDLEIKVASSCPQPLLLTANDITATSASLTWAYDAASYNIVVSTAQLTLPIMDMTQQSIVYHGSTGAKPFQIPVTLDPVTTYYWYVQLNCGAEQGEWNGSSFQTLQSSITPPYSHGFEDDNDENKYWALINGTQSSKWYINSAVHNGGSKSLYISADGGATNSYNSSSSTFATRLFNLSGGTTYTFEMDWKAKGEYSSSTNLYYDYFRVFLVPAATAITAGTGASGSDWNLPIANLNQGVPAGWVVLSDPLLQTGSTQSWKRFSVDYTVTTSGLYNLVLCWRASATTENNPPVAVDNVSVVPQRCAGVTGLASSSVTGTTATIAWSSTASKWNMKVSTKMIDPKMESGNFLDTISVTSSTFYLTNLSPSATYYVYVQANCEGEDGVSPWSSTTFTTPCGTATLPFSQDFESLTFPPACWNQSKGLASDIFGGAGFGSDGSRSWGRVIDTRGSLPPVCARIEVDGPHNTSVKTGTKNWLITPPISLSTHSELSFDLALTKYYSSTKDAEPVTSGTQPDDQFMVIVSEDAGATWKATNATVWNNTATKDYTYDLIAYQGANYKIDLSPYTGKTVKIAFYAESTITGNIVYIHLDNIDMHAAPPPDCHGVSMVKVENVTQTAATVNFTPKGEETAWQIAVGAPGFNPDDVTPVDVTGGTPSHQLTGLQPATFYEVYVRSDCGEKKSEWTEEALLFKTAATPGDLPYSHDFENETENNNWVITTSAHYWTIGTQAVAVHSGTKALYVCDVTGNYQYNANKTFREATSFASRLFDLPAGDGKISFDWKCQGFYNGTHVHVFRVFLVPDNMDLQINTVSMRDHKYVPDGWISLGDSTLMDNTAWKHWTKEFTVETAGQYKLVFLWYNNGGHDEKLPAAIDNIELSIREYKDCAGVPANIVMSNITTNGARIAWGEERVGPGEAPSSWYDIKLSTTPINPEIEDGDYRYEYIYEADKPYDVYDCDPNTTYYVYIRAWCDDAGDYSYWSDAVQFTTGCIEGTVPYTESFNTSGTGVGKTPNCWRTIVIGSGTISSDIVNDPANAPYCVSGQSGDSDNRSLRMYAYYDAENGASTKAFAVLPPFSADLSALQMEFSSYSSTTGAPMQIGIIGDIADISTFEPLTTIELGAWKTQKVKFNTYEGEGKYIAFRVNGDGSAQTYTGFIDGIKVDSIRDCQAPINPLVTDITTTSAHITWESLSQLDTVWQLQLSTVYVANIEDADTITNFAADTIIRNTPEVDITGLDPQTTYHIYLRVVCDNGNAYSSRFNLYRVEFTTECADKTYPYAQTFEGFGLGAGTLPDCWKVGGTAATKPHCDGTVKYRGSASLALSSTAGARAWATLPPVSNAINAAQLGFAGYKSTDASNIVVGVMTDPADYSTFVVVDTIAPTATAAWEDLLVSFASYSGTGKYIAFLSQEDNTFYVDNVVLEAPPACQRPKNLRVTNVSYATATVTWGAVSTPDSYEVKYGTPGFDPTVGGTLQTATATSVMLTGLQGLTSYDVYVRAVCGNNTSEWRGYATFKTLPTPATIPFSANFETTDTHNASWLFANSGANNKWYIGAAAKKDGSRGLYISNNNGNSNSYSRNESYAYAYRTLTLVSGAYEVKFDWYAKGRAKTDLLRAFLIPASVNLSGGGNFGMNADKNTEPANWIDVGNNQLNLLPDSDWGESSSIFAVLESGDYNLTFFWKNNTNSDGAQPPAAIDNVTVGEPTSCYTPVLMPPTDVSATHATLSWASNTSKWHVKVSTSYSSSPEYLVADICDDTITGSPTVFLSTLSATTTYYWYVRAVCQDDSKTPWAEGTFETPCGAKAVPFTEGFTSPSMPPLCWSRYDHVIVSELFSGLVKLNNPNGTDWRAETNNTILPSNHVWVNMESSNIYSWLVTPPVALPQNGGKLTFVLAIGSPSVSIDKFIVAVSLDNGETWREANATIWDNIGSPNRFSSFSAGGSTVTVNLDAFAGKEIKIGFYVESPQLGSISGSSYLHMDDVRVYGKTLFPYTASICGGNVYNGHGFSIPTAELTAGTHDFERTGINANGADSLIKLTLTVLPHPVTERSATICEGASYTDVDFQNHTVAGTYTRQFQTSIGNCDSVVMLHLTVIPTITHLPDVTVCEGGSYTGNGFVNLTKDSTYERTGGIVPSTTCDSIFILRLHVEETVHTSETIEITVNDLPYIYRDTTILAGTVPDDYVFTFHRKGSNDCDSIHTLNLLIGTGLSHTSVSTLNLTPNPVLRGGEVRVSVDFSAAERKDMQIEIFNSTGIRVLSLHPDTEPIVLSGFSESGIYVVRITTGTHGVYYGKLVVQ
ncbi:MAG: choice-of-anchor J domain-containing protein [Prevotellaceae bacterium]|nr:choice-of-anchor J domain-containing protein [Prevotellaceae bacterium]